MFERIRQYLGSRVHNGFSGAFVENRTQAASTAKPLSCAICGRDYSPGEEIVLTPCGCCHVECGHCAACKEHCPLGTQQ